jgi:hypothetical protein
MTPESAVELSGLRLDSRQAGPIYRQIYERSGPSLMLSFTNIHAESAGEQARRLGAVLSS